MKATNLERFKKISFLDYTKYESGKSNNGGGYVFWTDFNKLSDGKWEVSYGTTADFDFCPVCGSFNKHYEGDDCCYESGYSCGDFETLTESALLKLISEFEETDKKYIEYEEALENKYYNPSQLQLSGRKYTILEEYPDGSKKIKIPTFFSQTVRAYPQDLDGTYKEACERLWQKEKERIWRDHNW